MKYNNIQPNTWVLRYLTGTRVMGTETGTPVPIPITIKHC